jgi:hypothetical protein
MIRLILSRIQMVTFYILSYFFNGFPGIRNIVLFKFRIRLIATKALNPHERIRTNSNIGTNQINSYSVIQRKKLIIWKKKLFRIITLII